MTNISIGYLFIDQSESGLHFLKLMPPLSQHFEVLNKMADEIVGKRILCEGFSGEIKYVGLVPPTSGTDVKNISSDIKQLEWWGMKLNYRWVLHYEDWEKRTAKRLCVTSMTGLLLKCFLQSSLSLSVFCFFAKRSVWRKGEVWQKSFSNIIIVLLVTQVVVVFFP